MIICGSFGSSMSMRCEYCEGCDHLTHECPELHPSAPVRFNERLAATVPPMRCGYCEDNTHLTLECPGLRHNNASTRAFKALHGLACWKCKEPAHAGRKLHDSGRMGSIKEKLCGDCMANRCMGGVPLDKQTLPALPEPLRPWDCHAGETPTYDWVGDLVSPAKPNCPPVPPPPRYEGDTLGPLDAWPVVVVAIGIFLLGLGVGHGLASPRTVVVVPQQCAFDLGEDTLDETTWEVR